jgi:hypothetical protein
VIAATQMPAGAAHLAFMRLTLDDLTVWELRTLVMATAADLGTTGSHEGIIKRARRLRDLVDAMIRTAEIALVEPIS